MRPLSIACLALLSLSLVGCSEVSETEKFVKDSLSLMDQMAAAIESNDEAAVNRLVPEMKAMAERSKTITKPSADEEKSLKAKYEPEMKKAVERMMSAGMKNPQMMMKLKDLGPSLKGM